MSLAILLEPKKIEAKRKKLRRPGIEPGPCPYYGKPRNLLGRANNNHFTIDASEELRGKLYIKAKD